MNKKLSILVSFLLIATMLLSACGGTDTGTTGTGTTDNGTTDTDKDSTTDTDTSDATDEPASGEKVLKTYLATSPPTLNPHTTSTNYELLLDMGATLYREVYDPELGNTIIIPSIADGEPVPKDETNKVWTIKLQEGFTFADGTPIDANTFEYSFKMLNDPKLANRNTNATMLENGAAYLSNEITDWEEVGFQAVDDYTLEVTFAENHEPEGAKNVRETFCFVATSAVHPATYEASLNEDKTECSYGSTLDNYVASALYMPTSFIQGQYFELTRRTDGNAPLADVYTPDKVEYYVVADTNTLIQLFEKGELDVVVANQAAYDEYPGARYVYAVDNMGLYLNGETPTATILTDVDFRYALYWGLDRESVVEAVFPTSQPSAFQFLTFATMPDPADKDNKTVAYRETEEALAIRMDGHVPTQSGYDPDLAMEYFDKAYAANGNQKVTITALYSDNSDSYKTWAEAIQNHYQTLFGADRLEIVLQATPHAIVYEEMSRTNMNYDMTLTTGWYNIYDEPWNNTNWVYTGPYTYNTQYCTISDDDLAMEWDTLFHRNALYEDRWDAQAKLENTARMEEILLNDCSFIPAYNRGNRYFFSQKIDPIMEEGHPELLFCLMQTDFN